MDSVFWKENKEYLVDEFLCLPPSVTGEEY